jgi:ribosomal subunit interface protein
MQLIISTRHTEVSDGIRSFVEEQFSRLDRFERRITRVEVTLLEEKNRKEVEARLSIARAGQIHAHAESADFRSAVDSVIAKLTRQLKRQRSRAKDHKPREKGPVAAAPADEPAAS